MYDAPGRKAIVFGMLYSIYQNTKGQTLSQVCEHHEIPVEVDASLSPGQIKILKKEHLTTVRIPGAITRRSAFFLYLLIAQRTTHPADYPQAARWCANMALLMLAREHAQVEINALRKFEHFLELGPETPLGDRLLCGRVERWLRNLRKIPVAARPTAVLEFARNFPPPHAFERQLLPNEYLLQVA